MGVPLVVVKCSVSRFRSSPNRAARLNANFGISGTLATLCF
jgi:hypothetical protein